MLNRLHHDAVSKYENSISEPNFTFGNPIQPSWSSHFIHIKLIKKWNKQYYLTKWRSY